MPLPDPEAARGRRLVPTLCLPPVSPLGERPLARWLYSGLFTRIRQVGRENRYTDISNNRTSAGGEGVQFKVGVEVQALARGQGSFGGGGNTLWLPGKEWAWEGVS